MVQHFVLAILFVLTLASEKTVLYGNAVFSIFVLATKKRHSSFLKKVSIFQKIRVKVKVLKIYTLLVRFKCLLWKFKIKDFACSQIFILLKTPCLNKKNHVFILRIPFYLSLTNSSLLNEGKTKSISFLFNKTVLHISYLDKERQCLCKA